MFISEYYHMFKEAEKYIREPGEKLINTNRCRNAVIKELLIATKLKAVVIMYTPYIQDGRKQASGHQ